MKFCTAIFLSLCVTDTAVNFADTDGDGNCVSVTDGDGSQVLRERKTCFEGTDGVGCSLCGNGWGLVIFIIIIILLFI